MLTKTEIEHYRQVLLSMVERLKANLGQLREDAMQTTGGEASGGLSNVPLHLADLASRQWEEEITLGLVGNEEKILGEIDGALQRIQEGIFGRCEKCNKAIPKDRLQALPYGRFCVNCAREQEKTPTS